MVGWKARDEYFQPELARLAEAAALSLAPGINFYSLTMGDRTIGQATSRLDTLPDGGFELEDFMNLELPALGQTGVAACYDCHGHHDQKLVGETQTPKTPKKKPPTKRE